MLNKNLVSCFLGLLVLNISLFAFVMGASPQFLVVTNLLAANICLLSIAMKMPVFRPGLFFLGLLVANINLLALAMHVFRPGLFFLGLLAVSLSLLVLVLAILMNCLKQ